MSLDIAILDEAGRPAYEVAVSPNTHDELILQAKNLSLPLLSKMRDYFQDVDYTVQETLLLRSETDKLVAQCSGKTEFCALLEQLQSLVHLASKNQKNIVVIAD